MYLQVARSTVTQHPGDDRPFIESLTIGFIGLAHASASKDVQESA